MLAYACILPHSPLLLHMNKGITASSVKPKMLETFASIASELETSGIKTIISIAAHPRYERAGFSVGIAPMFSIDFSPFGDLASSLELKPHWPLYHALRSSAAKEHLVVHPIEDERIDYAHGIPLWILQRSWTRLDSCRLLLIHDHDDRTDAERLALGRALRAVIDEQSEPCAVICSGDFHTAHQGALPFETVKSRNVDLHHRLQGVFGPRLPETSFDDKTCLTGPAMILRGLRSGTDDLLMADRGFEHAQPTSFAALSWSLKA